MPGSKNTNKSLSLFMTALTNCILLHNEIKFNIFVVSTQNLCIDSFDQHFSILQLLPSPFLLSIQSYFSLITVLPFSVPGTKFRLNVVLSHKRSTVQVENSCWKWLSDEFVASIFDDKIIIARSKKISSLLLLGTYAAFKIKDTFFSDF